MDFKLILEVFEGLWGAFCHHFGAPQVAKSASSNTSQHTAANTQQTAANGTKKLEIASKSTEL